MKVNGYQGQVRARDQQEQVFKAGEEVMNIIQDVTAVPVDFLERMIIWSTPGTKFQLNGITFEMGKTYMYEIRNTQVKSLKFVNDSPHQTTIDYIIRKYDPFG